ncbi:MAG TPA: diguanylate cyclase, partial [bacterium]|nr:diguanylate cyclase [bacterium]
MHDAVIERIRTHRRTLAAQWARQIAGGPGVSASWGGQARLHPHMQNGVAALVESIITDRVEPFAEFSARLAQEAFALQVPLDELIRGLLYIKPLVLELVADPSMSPADVEGVRWLDRLISAGILEGIRRHEYQRDRRVLATQQQLESLRDRLRRQVLIDTSTGLHSSNYFAIAVRREVRRSRRFNRTFTLGLVAVDQEDEIREAWGEEGLHAVTLHVAGILTRATRQVDLRATLGSGRFGLILPETALEGAVILAERVRQTVETDAFVMSEQHYPMTQTVSIGLACFPQDAEDDRGLLARLEEALARARGG